jgi:hypothetical protein
MLIMMIMMITYLKKDLYETMNIVYAAAVAVVMEFYL